MDETYIIILIIAILILILYFVNFSGEKNDKVNEVANENNNKDNREVNQQIPTLNQFKPYNLTENFGSCGMPSQSSDNSVKLTQLTQSNKVDTTGKAILKIHVAMWCGWSKKLLQQLNSEEFKNKFNDIKNICVLDIIDCDINKERCDPSIVKGFPTIILQTKSNKMIMYKGDRTTDDLILFIKANSL
jgi:hypothetical protein